MDWQPIATAPLAAADGDFFEILVCEGSDGPVYVACWYDKLKIWMNPDRPIDDEEQLENKPTHWVHIPSREALK